jgi:hypothetical protein
MQPMSACLDRGALLAASLLLGACVSVPPGPSVMVLPGSRTSFEQFQLDDSVCRGFAMQQSGVTAQQAAAEDGVATAAVGTAVGAAAGAAIGAAVGEPAAGAAIGAGSGLLMGTAAGADQAYASAFTVQERYDHAYLQCMYAKGNQIPMARSALERPPAHGPVAAPPGSAPRHLPAPPRVGPPPPPPPDAG